MEEKISVKDIKIYQKKIACYIMKRQMKPEKTVVIPGINRKEDENKWVIALTAGFDTVRLGKMDA